MTDSLSQKADLFLDRFTPLLDGLEQLDTQQQDEKQQLTAFLIYLCNGLQAELQKEGEEITHPTIFWLSFADTLASFVIEDMHPADFLPRHPRILVEILALMLNLDDTPRPGELLAPDFQFHHITVTGPLTELLTIAQDAIENVPEDEGVFNLGSLACTALVSGVICFSDLGLMVPEYALPAFEEPEPESPPSE